MISYQDYHLNLLKLAYNTLIQQEPFNQPDIDPLDFSYIERFRQMIEDLQAQKSEAYEEGQELMTRLVRAYPHLVPMMARDLFWFFGGDALHYLGDEEIAAFQELDEARHAAEARGEEFNYLEARSNQQKLH